MLLATLRSLAHTAADFPYGVHACTGHYNVWTLWGSNGEPMLTHENGGDVVGSVVNLLWHDLELVIMSNEVTPLPDRETGWQYQESVRSTFLKNINYIIAHREQWRIIVHVRSLLPPVYFRILTLFRLFVR